MLRDQSGSNTLVSFLLGGLTGASLAVLFAPRSGEETSHDVALRSREMLGPGRDAGARPARRGPVLATSPRGLSEPASPGDPGRVPEPAVAAPPQGTPGLG